MLNCVHVGIRDSFPRNLVIVSYPYSYRTCPSVASCRIHHSPDSMISCVTHVSRISPSLTGRARSSGKTNLTESTDTALCRQILTVHVRKLFEKYELVRCKVPIAHTLMQVESHMCTTNGYIVVDSGDCADCFSTHIRPSERFPRNQFRCGTHAIVGFVYLFPPVNYPAPQPSLCHTRSTA